jgi:hypothetical protein
VRIKIILLVVIVLGLGSNLLLAHQHVMPVVNSVRGYSYGIPSIDLRPATSDDIGYHYKIWFGTSYGIVGTADSVWEVYWRAANQTIFLLQRSS